MADKNVKDTDIVERIRRLEEQVLPDGMNPAESVSGQQLADVLQGEGDEQPSFDAVDIKNGAVVGGSEVVTQDSGVPQHPLGDGTVHSDATLAELNSRVSDAALRDEADFYDTDAGSIYAASFATASDVPTPLSVGTIVHVEDEDQLYQQKGSGFEKVSPKRDIAFKEKAETFAESGVTVSNSQTRVNNESIEIGYFDDLADRADDNSTQNYDGKQGVTIVPNEPLSQVRLYASVNTSGATHGYISAGDGTILGSAELNNGGAHITGLNLSVGTEYHALLDADGATFTQGFGNDNQDAPYTSQTVDITGGSQYNGGDPSGIYSDVWCVGKVRGYSPYSNGTAHIEFPQPNYVYRWDAATFQATPDNETVDVYVEESTDGGSTWAEIDGPTNRGDMITAAADSEVRFRVELARDDVLNNPTLDSIYRRYVV